MSSDMEKSKTDSSVWTNERLAALNPASDWQPNVHSAFARFRVRREVQRIRIQRWAWALGGAITIGAGVLAFPTTRVFAQRCLDACVAETGRISQLISLNFSAKAVRAGERKIAPDFTLKDAYGKAVQLSSFRGKVVLLNFWATWCVPCRIETPWFVEFQRAYRDQDLVVLGVSVDEEGWAAVKPFIDEAKINYRVMIGNDDIARAYGGLESLPTTLLIDKQGRIAAAHAGLISKSVYEAEIQAVLMGQ